MWSLAELASGPHNRSHVELVNLHIHVEALVHAMISNQLFRSKMRLSRSAISQFTPIGRDRGYNVGYSDGDCNWIVGLADPDRQIGGSPQPMQSELATARGPIPANHM